jgi:TetR/AcrR family transcriptional repressor of lmrAB and yxaGH operons
MSVKMLKREELLLRLFSIFRRSGFDGATLSKISQETGLGKASLYHHFPGGKTQMAEEVLRFVEEWNDHNLIVPLSGSGKPKQKIKNMLATFNDMYEGGKSGCLIGVLVPEDAFSQFQDQIKRILTKLIEAIAGVLVEYGMETKEALMRAEEGVAKIQGSLILAKGTGQRALFGRLMKNLPADLLEPRSG